jgi:hypothetical protein
VSRGYFESPNCSARLHATERGTGRGTFACALALMVPWSMRGRPVRELLRAVLTNKPITPFFESDPKKGALTLQLVEEQLGDARTPCSNLSACRDAHGLPR